MKRWSACRCVGHPRSWSGTLGSAHNACILAAAAGTAMSSRHFLCLHLLSSKHPRILTLGPLAQLIYPHIRYAYLSSPCNLPGSLQKGRLLEVCVPGSASVAACSAARSAADWPPPPQPWRGPTEGSFGDGRDTVSHGGQDVHHGFVSKLLYEAH